MGRVGLYRLVLSLFTNFWKYDIMYVELYHMKYYVLPLRRKLRGKQVEILRGAAAVSGCIVQQATATEIVGRRTMC